MNEIIPHVVLGTSAVRTLTVTEPFSVEMMTGFVLIWTAVVVFTVDTVRTTARLRREINRRAAEDS